MKNTIEIAFKKLLGKGRAFRTPAGFMSDFLDLLVSPFSDLKTRFLGTKFLFYFKKLFHSELAVVWPSFTNIR